MKNLSGVKEWDAIIREELETANIDIEQQIEQSDSKAPYTIVGKLSEWKFTREWGYWVAAATNKGLTEKQAQKIEHLRKEVRIGGHAGGLTIKEWISIPIRKQLGICKYHIDTQKGLNAFADLLRNINK